MTRAPLLLLLALFAATPASAQETIRTMTPASVEKFIVSMTDKTKPGGRLTDDKTIQYLSTHLFDLGVYRSQVTFRIPGHDEQTRAIELDKPQFINNVIAGRQTIRAHQSGVTVHDIEISANKQEATFRTVTSERGEMPIEGQYIAFTGETNCIQKIALDGAIPVILSADCESVLNFSE